MRFVEAIVRGSAGARLLELDGLTAAVAPAVPERSLFNSVAYEDPRALAASVAEIAAAYEREGVRAWTVWVPETDGATEALLSSRGHRLDGSPRAMTLDLTALPESVAADREELDDAVGEQWSELCTINDAAYEGVDEGTFAAGMGTRPDPELRTYLARVDGEPACALSTIDHEGDCGVYFVATVPEHRRRGLAAALLRRALTDARRRGCTSSTLQASAAGRPLYEQLGYRDHGALGMWEQRLDGG